MAAARTQRGGPSRPGPPPPAGYRVTGVLRRPVRVAGDKMLSYVLAVLAACANATSSVLQRKANREVLSLLCMPSATLDIPIRCLI